MFSSITLVVAVSALVLASTHNAQGSTLKLRDKRMTKSMSDKYNVIKHEVLLQIGKNMCSGTIIADEYILSAAHCFTEFNTNKIIDYQLMEVTAGIKNASNRFEFHTVRLVEKIYIPRYFNNSVDTNEALYNIIGDIAVVKLNYGLGIGLDPRLEALKLPTYENHHESNHIIFSGFGATKSVYNYTTKKYDRTDFPQFLQYSKAEVYYGKTCVNVRNATLQMCAQIANNGAGICNGDSGGALFDLKEKTVIGVLSTGDDSCRRIAGTYTKVFPHYKFIMNAVNNVTDEIARVKSYEKDEEYRKALRGNPWKYYWIYIPDVVDDSSVRYSA